MKTSFRSIGLLRALWQAKKIRPYIIIKPVNSLWALIGGRWLARGAPWSGIGLFYLMDGVSTTGLSTFVSPQLHNWNNELNINLFLQQRIAGSQSRAAIPLNSEFGIQNSELTQISVYQTMPAQPLARGVKKLRDTHGDTPENMSDRKIVSGNAIYPVKPSTPWIELIYRYEQMQTMTGAKGIGKKEPKLSAHEPMRSPAQRFVPRFDTITNRESVQMLLQPGAMHQRSQEVGAYTPSVALIPFHGGITIPSAAHTPLHRGEALSAAHAPLRRGEALSAAHAPLRRGEAPSAAHAPLRRGEAPSAVLTLLHIGKWGQLSGAGDQESVVSSQWSVVSSQWPGSGRHGSGDRSSEDGSSQIGQIGSLAGKAGLIRTASNSYLEPLPPRPPVWGERKHRGDWDTPENIRGAVTGGTVYPVMHSTPLAESIYWREHQQPEPITEETGSIRSVPNSPHLKDQGSGATAPSVARTLIHRSDALSAALTLLHKGKWCYWAGDRDQGSVVKSQWPVVRGQWPGRGRQGSGYRNSQTGQIGLLAGKAGSIRTASNVYQEPLPWRPPVWGERKHQGASEDTPEDIPGAITGGTVYPVMSPTPWAEFIYWREHQQPEPVTEETGSIRSIPNALRMKDQGSGVTAPSAVYTPLNRVEAPHSAQIPLLRGEWGQKTRDGTTERAAGRAGLSAQSVTRNGLRSPRDRFAPGRVETVKRGATAFQIAPVAASAPVMPYRKTKQSTGRFSAAMVRRFTEDINSGINMGPAMFISRNAPLQNVSIRQEYAPVDYMSINSVQGTPTGLIDIRGTAETSHILTSAGKKPGVDGVSRLHNVNKNPKAFNKYPTFRITNPEFASVSRVVGGDFAVKADFTGIRIIRGADRLFWRSQDDIEKESEDIYSVAKMSAAAGIYADALARRIAAEAGLGITVANGGVDAITRGVITQSLQTDARAGSKPDYPALNYLGGEGPPAEEVGSFSNSIPRNISLGSYGRRSAQNGKMLVGADIIRPYRNYVLSWSGNNYAEQAAAHATGTAAWRSGQRGSERTTGERLRMLSVPSVGKRSDAHGSLFYRIRDDEYETGGDVRIDTSRATHKAQQTGNTAPVEHKTVTSFNKVDMSVKKLTGQPGGDYTMDSVQLNRLVNQVYEQLERKVFHERRRMGL